MRLISGGVSDLGETLINFYDNSRIIAGFLFFFYILAGVCAVRELMYSRTAQGSIAWLLSLAILPFPMALIYLAFGWKLFDDYAALQTFSGRQNRANRLKELGIADEIASEKWPVLTHVSQMPFLGGNEAKIFTDANETFNTLFESISKAKIFVLVQFYIIRDDNLGKRLADCLIERATAGIIVRVIYDDIGSSRLSKKYIKRLRDAGVQITAFNQRHKFLRLYGPMRINYRNHRKIVVIDGCEAWVGGFNIGDEYMGKSPIFGAWRDTQVQVRGPAALSCALVFREDWEWATGEKILLNPLEHNKQRGNEAVLVMPTGPADSLEDCAIAFTEMIGRARNKLWIVSPYFVPGIDIQTALYAAAMRGVDIRILLPKKADHLLVWLASYAHADKMNNHGVQIYRYQKGFLHQKIILVDNEIAGIGTVNFDNRSFSINFEVTLWFTDKNFISNVEEMLIKDFSNAKITTKDDLKNRPLWFKVFSQLARLLSPML